MKFQLLELDDSIRSLCSVICLIFPLGCGAVGSPIPPEDVGIEAKVRKQQAEITQSGGALSTDETIAIEENGVELPVFYPIGTR